MAISFEIDKVHRRIRTTVTAAITVRGILSHLESTHREDALGYPELIDAREAGQPFFSLADIWSAGTSVHAFKTVMPFGPRAVVVGNDTNYALTCIFAVCIMGLCSMNVFRDLKAAENWLA